MTPIQSDTDPSAERVQLELFRQASVGKKLSLVRSLSRTTIGLSRRAILRSASNLPANLPDELGFISYIYSSDLAAQICLRLFSMKNVEERMKAPPDLLAALAPVIDLFERLQAPYYLGGSIASSAHGVPRATADVDLVAALRDEHVKTLVEQLQDDYYIDETAIRRAIARHGSFNLIHLATMLKVDVFIPQGDLYDREAARRAVQQPLEEEQNARTFFLASAEDIVIAKLDWYRRGGELSERQWHDILGVLKVQGKKLDFDYLKQWSAQKNLGDLLQRAIDEAEITNLGRVKH